MSELPPDFGFGSDEDGMVNFMTVYTDFKIENFEGYMNFFAHLVQLAEDNPGVMPIYRPNDGK